ncbi:MAG: hypothetical protein Q8916_12055, partial [Bacteroidota bacterium]|nr:hypothetical protein [Bacteroidota bacterium]
MPTRVETPILSSLPSDPRVKYKVSPVMRSIPFSVLAMPKASQSFAGPESRSLSVLAFFLRRNISFVQCTGSSARNKIASPVSG